MNAHTLASLRFLAAILAPGPARQRLASLLQTLTLTLLALLNAPAALAAPSERGGSELVQLRLLSEHTELQPGQTRLLLGVEQRIAPHWHTYWINPGDSGQATQIEWQLSAGVSAGPILWPTPQRFNLGPLSNYGYSERALLLNELSLPAGLRPGQTLDLRAQVSWLVCKDICIPEQAELRLQLPVRAATAAANSRPSEDARLLAAARAALPQPAPWPLQAERQGTALRLQWPVSAADPAAAEAMAAEFFPDQWGHLQHSDRPQLQRQGAGSGPSWSLRQALGENPPSAGQALTGLLVLGQGEARRAYKVQATLAEGSAAGEAAASPSADKASAGQDLALWGALGLALLGGLVLNLMPCVFPVLSIKAFSLVQQAHGQAAQARRHGLAYTGGVLASFAALALLLISLKAAGAEVGWGFQFQSPLFVAAVAYVLFALGLSLSGVLQLGGSLSGLGQGLAERPGYVGSFFSGVLAAVVATPCTAPFMGAAIAFALAQPPLPLLAVFLSLGLGLALPYLLLSWWPALQAWLPRPGAWMEALKQALAFPMYGATIWLVWVLALQTGAQGVLLVLSGLGLIAWAAWLRASTQAARQSWARWSGASVAALALLAALGLAAGLRNLGPGETGSSTARSAAASTAKDQAFEPYSPERLAALRAQGKPVFVNLTAAWCISCLVNERVALSQPEVQQLFAARGITYLKGDWTHKDARISALLAEHGRSGVPLYLFYPAQAGAPAVILPQLLTPGIVTAALGS